MSLFNSFVILLVVISCVFTNTASQYRVIGGIDWDIRNSPYLVAVYVDRQHYRCVGSLITFKKVLTSELSLKEQVPPELSWKEIHASRINVKASTTNLMAEGNKRFAESIIRPSHFKTIKEEMDIAVIVLTDAYHQSAIIKTIPLCDTELNQGVKLRVCGWGSKSANVEEPSIILQSAEFEVVSMNECAACYEPRYAAAGKPFPTTLICLRDRAQASDMNSGDAGAPAVDANGKLCAVVSGGVEVLNPNYPTLYTSLQNNNVRKFINRAKLT